MARLYLYCDRDVNCYVGIQFENSIVDTFGAYDTSSFRVQFIDHRLFICGGAVDVTQPIPLSFRQRFIEKLAISAPSFEDEVVLAETFKDYFKEHAYSDLLTFEDDIAHIASVIIIFLESPGSLVELGMFCTKPEFYKKLLIIAPSHEVEREDSFIYLGPLEHIKKKEKNSVAVYPWPSKGVLEYDDIHLQDLVETLTQKLEGAKKTQRFNAENAGHVALLIIEIVRLSYPILLQEIELALASLEMEVSQSQVTRSLYLLQKLSYVATYEYSGYKYYYPTSQRKKPRVKFGGSKNGNPFDESKVMMGLKMAYVTDTKNASARKRLAAGKEIQKVLKESKQ